MLEQVESKIQQLKQQQTQEYYKKKEDDLLEWGLTNSKNGKKSIPLIITDEEYEALIEASAGLKSSSRNKTATLLNVFSVAILAIGLILAIVFYIFSQDLKLIYFSVTLGASILVALIFRGLAEAIRLLQQLIDEKRIEDFKKSRANSANKPSFPETQPQVQQQFASAPPIQFAYSEQYVNNDSTNV